MGKEGLLLYQCHSIIWTAFKREKNQVLHSTILSKTNFKAVTWLGSPAVSHETKLETTWIVKEFFLNLIPRVTYFYDTNISWHLSYHTGAICRQMGESSPAFPRWERTVWGCGQRAHLCQQQIHPQVGRKERALQSVDRQAEACNYESFL